MNATVRAIAVSALLAVAAHAAAQCLDVPALGSDRTVDVADASCVASRLASGGRHTVEFDLRLPAGGNVHELVLEAPGATTLELCVLVAGEVACREAAESPVRYLDLLLPGETVRVRASLRGDAGQAFQVAVHDRGPPQPGFAYEPNDAVATAWLLGDDLTVRGRFQGREYDVLKVEIEGDPQLWRVQVLGPTVQELNLLAASGRSQQLRRPESGDRGVRMSNLYLLPGPHYFSVRGTDGEYALRLIPLGPADEPPAEPEATGPAVRELRSFGTPTTPRESAAAAAVEVPVPTGPRPEGQMEREPNDDARTASLLRPGEPWVGLLSDPGDIDVYRFYLGQDGPVRITVTPPDGLALVVRGSGLSANLEPGETFMVERWYLAGDHEISLRADAPIDGYYQLLLERIDPLDLGDLPSPHGEQWRAQPLPPHHEIEAVLERSAWVRLPVLEAATTLTVEVEDGVGRLNVFGVYDENGSRLSSFVGRRDEGTFVAELPAGGPYDVRIDGGGPSRLRFVFDAAGPTAATRAEAPPVRMVLHGLHDVAAYHPYAQRLALELELHNEGPEGLALTLEHHLTDHGWHLAPHDTALTLAAGETRRVPLELRVDPVARDDLPIDITLGVRAVDGGVSTLTSSASAVCGAPLRGGVHAFGLPEPLLGGVNVGWTNLGAEGLVTSTRSMLLLFDGLTQPGGGWRGGVGEEVTVRLAGAGTPRIVGVALHPLSTVGVEQRLADFEIQTSLDGTVFTTVFRGRLGSPNTEQGFVFEAPVAARYVRLVALSNQMGNPRGSTAFGQLKIIAEPGSRVLGDRIDLGLREHGGHVAAALPFVSSYELTSLSGSSRPSSFRLGDGVEDVWWVHAFHHNRAALLDALVWHPHAGEGDASGERITEVAVSVSLDSPLGPWTEVGTWRVDAQLEWRFGEPIWARFVRFDAHFPDADRPTVLLPERVGLLEHPEGPDYRSVLGEWGHYVRDAAYEWRHPPIVQTFAGEGEHAARERALPVGSGETAGTHVLVGEYEAWFSFEVPVGSNYVELELLGDPTIDYLYRVIDAAGDPIVATVRAAPERVTFEAYLEPGTYYVHAWEPLRNVVFSWDDSGSMGPYVDATMQTVFGFARDVDPARELVQLQVFAREPYFLLDEWSGQPIEVLRTVLDYPRDEGASDLELNLAFVVDQLAEREGTRAVFLVSDAESGPSARNVTPLWEAFLEAPVRVFAFETSTYGSDDTQDRMQTYADVGGGFYDYSRTLGDLDVGFARASCLLRQPKAVRVALQVETREPPGPGALAIRRPQLSEAEREAARPAVHVIYDASGSMGQMIPDGSASRLEVARRVLTQLVDEVIDEGTPFALRAYGHVSPMTCDTALVHPLAPLDRAAARAAIASVDPKLLSQTPLAASIEAVAGDLAGSRGPKTVILLTDGEETCGGDPEAAIRSLMAHGIDVQLSIIGFDVDTDDAATMRANFAAWAAIGGGVFLEAFDAPQLRAALETALHADVEVRFEVVDDAGVVVAAGVVDGDAVPLPAGRYSVRVIGAQTRTIEGVEVRHEATTSLLLEAQE